MGNWSTDFMSKTEKDTNLLLNSWMSLTKVVPKVV